MEPVYSFNGSAIGFGAVLRSGNVKTVIPSLASVALAPTGGEGSAVSENFSGHGYSFTRAESRVFGSEIGDGLYATSADVYITNLNIQDRLRIALMTATISSTHNLKLNESSFDVRTSYRGIAVDGEDVLPEYDFALSSAPTYDDVIKAVQGDLQGYLQRWKADQKQLETALKAVNPIRPLGGSLVKDLKGKIQKHENHAIHVPGLGRAHFGEFLFKPGRRRVNLLRISLGTFDAPAPIAPSMSRTAKALVMMTPDPNGGDLTIGSVEGNGGPPM